MRPEKKCPHCGEADSTHLYSTRTAENAEFNLLRCPACKAVFLAPRPTDAQLAQAYAGDYYGTGESKFSGMIAFVIDWYRRSRARMVASLVRAPAAVLDVGCGDGRFLSHLIETGYSCSGVEREGKAAERARRVPGLRLITSELAPLAETGEQFDVVTLWHVFEHLSETAALRQLARLVRKDGYLILTLPNIESFQSRVFRGAWFHLDPPRHLLFFPQRALVAELQKFGLRHLRTRYFSLEYNPFGFQQSLLNCFLATRDELYESLKSHRAAGTNFGMRILFQRLFFVTTFPLFACIAAIESLLGRGATMEIVFRR